jgi:hypothetical protein
LNAKLKALAAARANRAIAQPRKAPEGYRSVEHFLDCAREAVGRRPGSHGGVGPLPPRQRIKREKIPLQHTIDAIHRWLLSIRP